MVAILYILELVHFIATTNCLKLYIPQEILNNYIVKNLDAFPHTQSICAESRKDDDLYCESPYGSIAHY